MMSGVFEKDIDQIDISELEDDIVVEEENQIFEYPDPLYKLKLEYSSEGIYATTNNNLALNAGDYVIIPTRYGKDLALVMGKVNVPIGIKQGDIVYIERKATKEQPFILCLRKITKTYYSLYFLYLYQSIY
jgi:hypothetical protein